MCVHLHFCLVAIFFLFAHLFRKSTHILLFLPLTQRKDSSEGEQKYNLAETLGENEFHRLLQFQIPVLLFPKSVRKAMTLPPKMHRIPKATVGKWGSYTSFSLQVVRGRLMQAEPKHKSFSPDYWREIKLMLRALKVSGLT